MIERGCGREHGFMFVTCDVFHLLMSALKSLRLLPSNRLDMSVMSDVSQSPMSS